MNKDNFFTIWTIQTEEAYEVLRQTGELFGTREHIMFEDSRAYDWLCSKMKARGILPEKESYEYPIWAWYSFLGKKPDLRTTGFVPKGTKAVRLELRVDLKRVLLSDFDLWHYVLNDWYVATSEEELAKFNNNEYFRKNRKKTWNRIFRVFDYDFLSFYGITRENQNVQATMWNITMDDVVCVKHFVGR